MDYSLLLEGCCVMGCEMLSCGAEIYRVEDTVRRLLAAYNIDGEVFAIPNCVIVSIADDDGEILTRMHRASPSSTDIALLESYNALSRRLCAKPPKNPGTLLHEIYLIKEKNVSFPLPLQLLGYFIGAFFFCMFFGGGILDAFVAGFGGLAAGVTMYILDRCKCNYFIATVVAAFFLAFIAYIFLAVGLTLNIQMVISGAIMSLVPGLVFTNFLSDLLTGDVIAGLSTFVRAMLSAAAVALGTCFAMAICLRFTGEGSSETVDYGTALRCLFAFAACMGYCFGFNIRGSGAILCCLGGGAGWLIYELLLPLANGNQYIPTLIAAIAVAIYAEIMARVRKCPATAYLLVSFFPLVPGRTIYLALNYGIRGELDMFWDSLFLTFGIAGCLALGSLIVTNLVRMIISRRNRNSVSGKRVH